ncbi:MAG: hypothetical protein LBC18_11965 [Opitutaceae bacterium]|nr:hypothetical protein [Opitutaceae bacterium]
MKTPPARFRPFLPCLLLSLAAGAALHGADAAGVRLYTPTPGDTPCAVYALTVNGAPAPVVKFGDVSYSRFIINGPAEISVTTPEKIGDARVSPMNSKRTVLKKGKTLSFNIGRAGSYFVRVDKLEPLIIFADPPEAAGAPRPGDPRVIDLSAYLPPGRDPAAPVTALIQKAIDDTAAQAGGEGGILFVPNGRHVAGQLKLKSNVFLHLADGALLQSQVDFNATDFPPQANSDSSFIFIGNARNVRIGGRGIIDGNGHAVRTLNPKANIKLLRTAGAGDVLVEDVFFRDSARWSLHLLDSERVVMRNFKLVNDLRGGFDPKEKVHKAVVTNTDGVDIDASRGVLVEGAFIYTGDDAFTPKVTGYMGRQGPCRDLVMRGNVIWTIKCALKVGDETIEDLHDMDFSNNHVIHADRFLALWSGDGGRIGDMRIINNKVESIGGDYNERFFMFRVRLRRRKISRPGVIENIVIKDFQALSPAPQPSSFEGLGDGGRITGVSFENIVIGGKRAQSAEDIPLRVKDGAGLPVFIK